eukprot:TRINITY_DN4809_c0_g4_i1.p1 TRINITY_DN4809_c0_g4~~TRINITY_DN4809_c0_g4_i1.p1  ORF type:complete len:784 (+),score=150.71 TRINITY_DN4809_c0_g4_i1:1095-3446(+)
MGDEAAAAPAAPPVDGTDPAEEAAPAAPVDPEVAAAEANQAAARLAAALLRAQRRGPACARQVGAVADVPDPSRAQGEGERFAARVVPSASQEGGEDAGAGAYAAALAAAYRAKKGDIVDELAANLRFPPPPASGSAAAEEAPAAADPATAEDRVAALAVLANAVARRAGAARGALTLAELLSLRIATAQGPDIDRDLGFAGVPPPRRRVDGTAQLGAWEEYARLYSDWSKSEADGGRNGCVMTAAAAGAAAASAPAAAAPEKPAEGEGAAEGDGAAAAPAAAPSAAAPALPPDAWIKWVCLLWAVCAAHPADPQEGNQGRHVLRVLRSVPEEVWAQHRALTPGDLVWWPRPAVGTLSRTVALGCAKAAAAEGTQRSLLLKAPRAGALGLAARPVSHYPDEEPVVLPPLCLFRVTGNVADTQLGLTLELRPEAAARSPEVTEFLREVRADAVEASKRLALGPVPPEDRPQPVSETYTYAELGRRGPRHTSIPADTAWREMLWVVERAEELADDSARWMHLGASARPPPGEGSPRAALLAHTDPLRPAHYWPPGAASPQAVAPRGRCASPPASPALTQHEHRHLPPVAPRPAAPERGKQPPAQVQGPVPWDGPPAVPWEGADRPAVYSPPPRDWRMYSNAPPQPSPLPPAAPGGYAPLGSSPYSPPQAPRHAGAPALYGWGSSPPRAQRWGPPAGEASPHRAAYRSPDPGVGGPYAPWTHHTPGAITYSVPPGRGSPTARGRSASGGRSSAATPPGRQPWNPSTSLRQGQYGRTPPSAAGRRYY